jgi:hypothetical protein
MLKRRILAILIISVASGAAWGIFEWKRLVAQQIEMERHLATLSPFRACVAKKRREQGCNTKAGMPTECAEPCAVLDPKGAHEYCMWEGMTAVLVLREDRQVFGGSYYGRAPEPI